MIYETHSLYNPNMLYTCLTDFVHLNRSLFYLQLLEVYCVKIVVNQKLSVFATKMLFSITGDPISQHVRLPASERTPGGR